MIGRRQELNLQVYQLLDVGLLAGCLWVGYNLRSAFGRWTSMADIPAFSEFFWVLAITAPLGPIFLEVQGFYEGLPNKSPRQSLRQMLGALLWIGILIGFCEVFLHWRVPSRSVLVLQFLLGGVLLLLRESWVKHQLRRRLHSSNRERVLLAGETADMDRYLRGMTAGQRAEIEVVSCFDITQNPVEHLVELLHSSAVSRVIFTVRHVHFSRIEEAVQACETEGVEAWLSADFFQTAIAKPTFDILDGKVMLVFHTTPPVSWSLMLKSVGDRLGALIFLLVTLPIWALAIVGIKLTSPQGSVFFTQQRSGRNGRPFKLIKFRTMQTDAETRRVDLEGENLMQGPTFKVKDDPRIFAFGRWLRRTSMDELPQLLNVLRGEMSLVGPRPLPVYEIARIEKPSQRRRLSVKPGLTCLWQISGRNCITSFEEWVRLDLEYIDNWSLWLDVKILFKTLPAVWRGHGAC